MALAACAACASPSNLPAEDVAAGKVIEIIGSARITTPAETRELQVGDEVAGRDVIRTGPDSWVRIALFHNGVTWGLGPDKERRVADSVAWKAPRGTGDSLLDEKTGPDRSVAAGRHAEREAADTRATLPVPGGMADEQAASAEETESAAAEDVTVAPERDGAERARHDTPRQDKSASSASRVERSAEPVKHEERARRDDSGEASQPDSQPPATQPERELAVKRPIASDKAAASRSITAPLPVVRFESDEDAVDGALLTGARMAVLARLRGQPKCQLLSDAKVSARVVLQTDGRLELGGALPKDPAVAACLQAAFSKLAVREVALASPVALAMTIEWPGR